MNTLINRLEKKSYQKGFTLLEILLVVAAIGILATILILTLDPGSIFERLRDLERKNDLSSYYDAIVLDPTGELKSRLSNEFQEICDEEGESRKGNDECINVKGKRGALSTGSIEKDPSLGGNSSGTGYYVRRNPDTNDTELYAPLAEDQEVFVNVPKEYQELVRGSFTEKGTLAGPKPFIMTVDTSLNGATGSEEFQIKTQSSTGENYDYSYDVNWGDGKSDDNVTGDITHLYNESGEYDIEINGYFPALYYPNFNDDAQKITDVKQWGDIQWKSMNSMFKDAEHLSSWSTIDTPDLSQVTDMSFLFSRAGSFNQDIGEWDVSNVTDMSYMFYETDRFNQDISTKIINAGQSDEYTAWDVSNVNFMLNMFNDADNFNQDIGNWNVSSVENMYGMFGGSS